LQLSKYIFLFYCGLGYTVVRLLLFNYPWKICITTKFGELDSYSW